MNILSQEGKLKLRVLHLYMIYSSTYTLAITKKIGLLLPLPCLKTHAYTLLFGWWDVSTGVELSALSDRFSLVVFALDVVAIVTRIHELVGIASLLICRHWESLCVRIVFAIRHQTEPPSIS